ncbi:MAG: DUF4124 domain-containing protein [Gammaproteobacteria bacterium]|nr:DUF4124 domain-containing protein [Gammaproteobacteria bacterium]
MRINIIFYILSSLVFTGASAAEVYRWTDENGNVQFGDNPNQTKFVEQIKIPIFKDADPAYLKHLQQQKKYLNARQDERQKNAVKKEKESQLKKALALKCKDARNKLKIFTENSRVYIRGKEGRRYLTPDEFSDKKQRANDEIMTYCKSKS